MCMNQDTHNLQSEVRDANHPRDWCCSQLLQQGIGFTLNTGNALQQAMQEQAVVLYT